MEIHFPLGMNSDSKSWYTHLGQGGCPPPHTSPHADHVDDFLDPNVVEDVLKQAESIDWASLSDFLPVDLTSLQNFEASDLAFIPTTPPVPRFERHTTTYGSTLPVPEVPLDPFSTIDGPKWSPDQILANNCNAPNTLRRHSSLDSLDSERSSDPRSFANATGDDSASDGAGKMTTSSQCTNSPGRDGHGGKRTRSIPDITKKPRRRRDDLVRTYFCFMPGCDRSYCEWRSLQYHLSFNHELKINKTHYQMLCPKGRLENGSRTNAFGGAK
eukprot:comp12331_c0_seq1/m.7190 comp12331_c0_seq1/g.7190  ORF comp12331_c0_seq1/g.7190 comp12331_c0_seq1/m.7190 type:complete len:271 (-) comp12331_c0_seq1:631-1443(-)